MAPKGKVGGGEKEWEFGISRGKLLYIGWINNKVGLPWWLSGKESTCNAGAAGDVGLIPGLGRSPGGGQPTPVFLPGESHRQRSLAGYGPQGHEKSDTTEAT